MRKIFNFCSTLPTPRLPLGHELFTFKNIFFSIFMYNVKAEKYVNPKTA